MGLYSNSFNAWYCHNTHFLYLMWLASSKCTPTPHIHIFLLKNCPWWSSPCHLKHIFHSQQFFSGFSSRFTPLHLHTVNLFPIREGHRLHSFGDDKTMHFEQLISSVRQITTLKSMQVPLCSSRVLILCAPDLAADMSKFPESKSSITDRAVSKLLFIVVAITPIGPVLSHPLQ